MRSNYQAISEDNVRRRGEENDDIFELFSKKLYSDPTHFVYEMIQNAEDTGATKINFKLEKEELSVEHDGRKFSEQDVCGITDILKGSKKDDPEKIGKFGIGFKSVYAFTATPAVHSGDEDFVIRRYIRPELSSPIQGLGKNTRFILPFDHKEVAGEEAFPDIATRLSELDTNTLLFLKNIRCISWQIENGQRGSYLRKAEMLDAAKGVMHVELEHQSDAQAESTHWLVFGKAIEVSSGEKRGTSHFDLAFHLESGKKIDFKRIRSLEASPLFAYFSTRQETNLKFLINGPYNTAINRESIPDKDIWNAKILQQTAELLVEAIIFMRDNELLAPGFFDTLPIEASRFPENGKFRPLFDSCVIAFKKNELLPKHGGGFADAKSARIAQNKDLIDLLPDDFLKELLGVESVSWLSQDLSKDFREYLKYSVQIKEITDYSFIQSISEQYLKNQSDGWRARFYGFLGDQPPWSYSSLLSKAFICLEDGNYVVPFSSDSKPNAYLPPSNETEFPIIKRCIAKDAKARKFFEKLGYVEPDIVEEVLLNILPKYESKELNPELSDVYISDLKLIASALKTDYESKKNNLINALRETPWCLVQNCEKQLNFIKPSDAYLRTKQLELYFENNVAAFYVIDSLGEHLDFSLSSIGINSFPKISCRKPENSWEPHITIVNQHAHHVRGLNGFDPEFWVDGLEHALSDATMEKAVFIWNELLRPNHKCIRGEVEESNRSTFNPSKKKASYSKAGELVSSNTWLPDSNGVLHKPCELSLLDLPDDFMKDNSLARALGMKATEVEALARQAGLDYEILEYVKRHPDKVRVMMEDEPQLSQIGEIEPYEYFKDANGKIDRTKEIRSKFNRPKYQEKVDTSSGRQDAKQNLKSPEAKPPTFLQFVRLGVDPESQQLRSILEHTYNGQCQICRFTFKRRDGNPHFEGLHILNPAGDVHYIRLGNSLCVCPNCAAKLLFGDIQAQNILDQIRHPKLIDNAGNIPALAIMLCDEEASIGFAEVHFQDLQEMLTKIESNAV